MWEDDTDRIEVNSNSRSEQRPSRRAYSERSARTQADPLDGFDFIEAPIRGPDGRETPSSEVLPWKENLLETGLQREGSFETSTPTEG